MVARLQMLGPFAYDWRLYPALLRLCGLRLMLLLGHVGLGTGNVFEFFVHSCYFECTCLGNSTVMSAVNILWLLRVCERERRLQHLNESLQ